MSQQTTRINIEQIPCYCSIGIHDEEKRMGQRLLIDAYVDIFSANATKSDDIDDGLSYVDVYALIQRTAKSKSHSLIETLANEIADEIIKNKLVKSIKIRVHKPHVPFPEFQGKVSVEVERAK